jgi:hypothetical protein
MCASPVKSVFINAVFEIISNWTAMVEAYTAQ